MSEKPILITMGDPNGLGPELACRLLGMESEQRDAVYTSLRGARAATDCQRNKQGAGNDPDPSGSGGGCTASGSSVNDGKSGTAIERTLLIIGPEHALSLHATRLGIPPFWQRIDNPEETGGRSGIFLYEPEAVADVSVQVGKETAEGGRSAGVTLDTACSLVKSGYSDAIVTLPLHKAMLQEAGFAFPGHTEFLARYFGLRDEDVCMHLCGDRLRVSLVTTHPPLREVPKLVTRERILHCLSLTVEYVNALGKGDAPVAVCGLNPHAGESGKIGNEDQDVVEPAIREAQQAGLNVMGPYPADTVFYRAAKGDFSAVLAMYHDQGLGPLKLLHFSRAVNVTLGLPFIRTSVDHGTGFDIAGKDVADIGSFAEALKLASQLLDGRKQRENRN